MSHDSNGFQNSKTSKIVFLLSIFIFIYWCLEQIINVYRFALVGAIFELLWLFMLVGLFGLPILCMIYWVKEKFNLRSLYLYSLIITVTTILLRVFFS